MKHAHSKKGHLNYTINNYIYDFMYTTGGIYTSVLMPSSTGTWNAPPAHDRVELTRIELVHNSSALVSFPFLATQSQSLQRWPNTSWTVITVYYLSHCDYCLLCILQAFMKMTKIPSVYLGNFLIVSDIITTPILRLGISNEQIVLQGYWNILSFPGPILKRRGSGDIQLSPMQASLKVYSLLYA